MSDKSFHRVKSIAQKEISEFARKKGIFTVIDGAQAVGHIDVDLIDLSCDAYYSSLH